MRLLGMYVINTQYVALISITACQAIDRIIFSVHLDPLQASQRLSIATEIRPPPPPLSPFPFPQWQEWDSNQVSMNN